jgi:hypothetical protein
MPEAVFPHREHAIALRLGQRRELGPHDLLLDRAHVPAVPDQVRHLEEPELVDLGRHDRRREREVHGAELDLLEEHLVAAELARSVRDYLPPFREPRVRAARELVGREREERAGLAHVPEREVPWGPGVGTRGQGHRDGEADRASHVRHLLHGRRCARLDATTVGVRYHGGRPGTPTYAIRRRPKAPT